MTFDMEFKLRIIEDSNPTITKSHILSWAVS